MPLGSTEIRGGITYTKEKALQQSNFHSIEAHYWNVLRVNFIDQNHPNKLGFTTLINQKQAPGFSPIFLNKPVDKPE
ncbi:hypothetical protein GL58_10290 [Comamonas testosteroni]|uniref:Uncharacterized protein n=2 Tax=Comamonas testosteroni TaxID=285 RepID=A0A0L7MGJ7_COMTE|nr:hypothetical protein GL58_10290 [Comamonas testosteroni]